MNFLPVSVKGLLCLVVLQFVFTVPIQAQLDQNGWSLIASNDFSAAKTAFQHTLDKNPNDVASLTGMVFIAETVQDYKMYKKYIRQLIESEWDDQIFALFGHMYEENPEVLLNQLNNEKLRAPFIRAHSDSLFQKRKFKASGKLLRSLIGDYNWSLIGPFTNISGSGYQEETLVESQPFNRLDSFENENGLLLKWKDRRLRAPSGIVDFQNTLPSSSQAMYYANTFIHCSTDRTVQFRIRRKSPMKIWLDDQLVFQNENNIAFKWDFEIVQLDLKAGTHRILVKCAEYPDYMQSNTIFLDYHEKEDEGEGYQAAANFYYNYDYSYDQFNYFGGNESQSFALRITDTQGRVYQDLGSRFDAAYQAEAYTVKNQSNSLIQYFKQALDSAPEQWLNYYLLCKAFMLYDYVDEGEAYFYQVFQKNQESAYIRYLMAKFYASNGKGEKAEELISGLDEQKTPFFAIMKSELSKIDQEKNEPEYLAVLEKLLDVSPTNWGIISTYLDYYGKKGKTKEKREFIELFLAKYPDKDFKKRLEPYLEDDSYKPSSFKPKSDKEKEKTAKEAMKRIKKRFKVSDYRIVISYYKQKEKKENVLRLYDELIRILPYRLNWRTEKANYLFELDQLDEALAELQELVRLDEFDPVTYETIGDIYVEKDDKSRAYSYYQKALELKKASNSGNYGLDALENKMEKIKEKSSLKEHFQSLSFEDAIQDEAWKDKYPDEESVILLYAIESALDKDNTIDYNQRMMIYIQNEAGAKYWTEANFGFLGSISFVKVLKKDGQVINPTRNYGYVVFKNLEPGDIIQIEGSSRANMNRELHGEMYHIAALSHDVPVYKAMMEFIHPKDQTISYSCYRLDCAPISRDVEDYRVLSWSFEDVPKMEREAAVLDNLDSYAWIMFSTQTDWSEIADWYLRKTYKRLESNYEIENELLGIISEGMSDEEIVETIYNYVTKEITYSHVSFLNSNYTPKKPSSTISDEIGDCKDVASLMITMLRRYDIEAYYVLVRSSNFTNSEPEPTILAFNHVIVGYVLEDGIMRYLDLTTDYYPHYVIPEFDNNSWALVVREGEDAVFRLPNDMLDPTKTRLELDIKAKVNSDRSLVLEAQTVGKGVLGGKLREELNRVTTEEDRKKFLLNYFGEGSFDHLSLNSFSFSNLEDISAPLEMAMQMKAYNYIERVSDFYIVQVPLLNAITTRPTLFTENRYNNLDLNALFETAPSYQRIELEIPEDFKLMDLPQNIHIDNEFGRYSLTFESLENGIKINRSFELKTRLIKYEDYGRFKDFYIELLDADRMKIALTQQEPEE